jgi:hypothetical protein
MAIAPPISHGRASCSACLALETRREVRDHSRRRTPHAAAPLPVLRRPHDHHRDLRGRLPTKTPSRPGNRGGQHRYLVMPSHAIHQPDNARHSGWLSAARAPLSPIDDSACSRTANSLGQCPLRSFHPSSTPRPGGKAIATGNSIQPCPA